MRRIKDYLWDALIIGGATVIAVLIAFAVLSVRVAHADTEQECAAVGRFAMSVWGAADNGASLQQITGTLRRASSGTPKEVATLVYAATQIYDTRATVIARGDEYDPIEVYDLFETMCLNDEPF